MSSKIRETVMLGKSYPMDEAPKDGTWIYAFESSADMMMLICWNSDKFLKTGGFWIDENGSLGHDYYYDFWCPMP